MTVSTAFSIWGANAISGGTGAAVPGNAASLFGFFGSPLGITIAWIATILGVIFGIVSIVLYFAGEKKNRDISRLIETFGIAQKLEDDVKSLADGKLRAQDELNSASQEISSLREEIEHKVPIQAKIAFYQAAIPEIERQISALMEQRRMMLEGIKSLPESNPQNDAIKNLISKEVEENISARRGLDENQIKLSIFTGLAAAISGLGYFTTPFTFVIGFFILYTLHDLGSRWAKVYPDSQMAKLISTKYYKILPHITAGLLAVAGLAFAGYVVWLRLL